MVKLNNICTETAAPRRPAWFAEHQFSAPCHDAIALYADRQSGQTVGTLFALMPPTLRWCRAAPACGVRLTETLFHDEQQKSSRVVWHALSEARGDLYALRPLCAKRGACSTIRMTAVNRHASFPDRRPAEGDFAHAQKWAAAEW
jgi:hypothetical protein